MLWCFILLNFLYVVCCWSSGHFPTLLWMLCLRGSSVFLHDQCCFDPDGWMLFPSLDVNLQLNLSLCVCLLYKSIFYTIFQLGNAILLFQCWVFGFSSLLTCSTEHVIRLEYRLWWWLPGFQQDTLPKSELCAECKYKGLLVHSTSY